ncbi:hypothetical protein K439DRAFT_1639124 [Ramaria rubella]|nr:hypothetical protein K439DRAFT_1639124 [Ramaria rubella]
MAPSAQCSALANALAGKGWSYGQLASQSGLSEQQVTNICTGAANPSQNEFNAIAGALGISTASAPNDGAHAK